MHKSELRVAETVSAILKTGIINDMTGSVLKNFRAIYNEKYLPETIGSKTYKEFPATARLFF